MNVKTVGAVVLVCGATMLGGCARMHSKGDPSAMAPGTENPGKTTMGAVYVAKVDRRASDRGVQVAGVNPPDKARHN
ncbi:MAG TPA: hypothetical protein VGH80_14645 [Xanthomonadaceae bacterium]